MYHYTKHYLIEVLDEETVEDGTLIDQVKMDVFEPYITISEHDDGDVNYEQCSEKEACQLEQQRHFKREIAETEK
jgi:hypothetical protein